ncbi:MAG: cytochrome C oxidase subunit IV family protein [Verrucomicrobiota bacterium]
MSEHAESHDDPDQIHHHISPLSLYIKVFLALMVLTWVTVAVSKFDLGVLNLPVALLVAFTKASLVLWFFMHLSHSAKITWVCAFGSLIWLGVMLFLTLGDYVARRGDKAWIPFPETWL